MLSLALAALLATLVLGGAAHATTTAEALVSADPGGSACTDNQSSAGGLVEVTLFCIVRPAAEADASAYTNYYSMGGHVYAAQTDDLSFTDAQADGFFADFITIDRPGFQGTGGQVYFDVAFAGTATASGSGSVTGSLKITAKFSTFPTATILNTIITDTSIDQSIETITQLQAFRYGEPFPLTATLALQAATGDAPGAAHGDFSVGASIVRLNVSAGGGLALDPALYTVTTQSTIPIPESGALVSQGAAIAVIGLIAVGRRKAQCNTARIRATSIRDGSQRRLDFPPLVS